MLSAKPIALALALAPMAGGCSTLSFVTTEGAVAAFKPIGMSRRDTCETQKQVAEHNSRLETLKSGKETVYKAPCQIEKRNPVPASEPSSTS